MTASCIHQYLVEKKRERESAIIGLEEREKKKELLVERELHINFTTLYYQILSAFGELKFRLSYNDIFFLSTIYKT